MFEYLKQLLTSKKKKEQKAAQAKIKQETINRINSMDKSELIKEASKLSI